MKRINDSVEQQSVEFFKLKDMKIASNNKSQISRILITL